MGLYEKQKKMLQILTNNKNTKISNISTAIRKLLCFSIEN